jgi:ribonuclease VapC
VPRVRDPDLEKREEAARGIMKVNTRARSAWKAAALNLGDCCAYAASKIEGGPPLFKGQDFEKTDVAKNRGQCSLKDR